MEQTSNDYRTWIILEKIQFEPHTFKNTYVSQFCEKSAQSTTLIQLSLLRYLIAEHTSYWQLFNLWNNN